MSKKEDYESRAEALILPILEENGFSLYDSEFVKEAGSYYLRIYIDKPGGITIDDCELVSRAFNTKLDEEDFIEEAYIMEISSPGLGRQLKKDRHFEKSLGEEVDVKLFKKGDYGKEFTGILESYDKENVSIRLESGEVALIKRSEISSIRLSFSF